MVHFYIHKLSLLEFKFSRGWMPAVYRCMHLPGGILWASLPLVGYLAYTSFHPLLLGSLKEGAVCNPPRLNCIGGGRNLPALYLPHGTCFRWFR